MKGKVKVQAEKLRRGIKVFNTRVLSFSSSGEAPVTETLVILLQVAQKDQRMEEWATTLSKCSLPTRIAQLRELSASMREDPAAKELADALDRLQDPRVFEAFLKTLTPNTFN